MLAKRGGGFGYPIASSAMKVLEDDRGVMLLNLLVAVGRGQNLQKETAEWDILVVEACLAPRKALPALDSTLETQHVQLRDNETGSDQYRVCARKP
jgi:hypothetical protein